MTMAPVDAPTGVDDLDLHDHACWVPVTDGEQRRGLTRYIKAGLDRHERVAYFGTPSRRSEAVAFDLARAGVPVDELAASGQLVFASARDQYDGGSRFDPVRRLDDYASAVRATVADGYRGFRVAAEVAWLADEPEARQAWPGYEFGADLLAARLPFTALCVYDPHDWRAADLALMRSVHSHRIAGGVAGGTGFRLYGQRDGSIRLRGELDAIHADRVGDVLRIAGHSGATVLDLAGLEPRWSDR